MNEWDGLGATTVKKTCKLSLQFNSFRLELFFFRIPCMLERLRLGKVDRFRIYEGLYTMHD